MTSLNKNEKSLHDQALKLLEQEELSQEDKIFIFNNYRSGAPTSFTTLEMASWLAHDAIGDNIRSSLHVVDLCAGIGSLTYAILERNRIFNERLFKKQRLVCIDRDPVNVEIGKKLVPEAEWYCADVMDKEFLLTLGKFEIAVSNPPFGNVASFSNHDGYNYTGVEAEYRVMDVASLIADELCFVIPQMSAGFCWSVENGYRRNPTNKFKNFVKQTGINLEEGIGYDIAGLTGQTDGTFVEFVHADVSDITFSTEM